MKTLLTFTRTASFFIMTLTISISILNGAYLPEEAQRLVQKHQEAVARIDKKLINELNKLKVKYTKAGNLDAANAVNNLMKTKEITIRSADERFVGEWLTNAGGDRNLRELRDNGFCYESGKRVGKWNYTKEDLTISFDSGTTSKFLLPIKDGKLTGRSSKRDRSWGVTMQKVIVAR